MKNFAYAGQNLGGDYRKGKLLTAKRTNWVINPSVPQIGEIPIEVTELYRYQSISGRVSSRTTSTNIANMPQFAVAYQYNNLGLVSKLTYPRCGGPGSFCTTPFGGGKSLGFSYDHAQLVAIPGYLNRLTYHPNGMAHEIEHSNGITDVQDEDPWHMRRPLRIHNQLFNEQLAGGLPAVPLPDVTEAQTNARCAA